ncbi:serine hydrolase domain-containing protein [Pandoraea sp. PE-S2T-3]|uniref:serine hydrolase domain-containing protein n=1 Tax=Pandoraea sp. PE-S2T-3 TaxID=1986993 RepID=UPI001125182B|nr:serine hydrolase domain-containing protein [Pandoraea sp. PE-S2T-3]
MDLDNFLAQVTSDGPIAGVSLATLRAGERGIERYAGIRGSHDPAAVDAQTVFEAASLTKPLVAFIALQLIEEGRLDLHRPLIDICGEYVANDPRARAITAFHVLTHTSGLPNIVRDEAPLRTYFTPGERFSYGSSAFAWLQRAMETVGGASLETLACARVFAPLGMHHSSLHWQERFAENHAQGHEWEGEPVPKRRLPTAQASWSLLTTAFDYIVFVQAVLAGRGLSDESHAAWFEPRVNTRQVEVEDLRGEFPADPAVGWGLGWGIEIAQQCCFHWGNSPGFRALVLANRQTRDAIVWFANSARGLRLAHTVVPLSVAGEHPCIQWLNIGHL